MAKKSENKTLFDHLKAINEAQNDSYFSKLSDADKKTWSTYMVNRYLSMEPEYIELINSLQQYTLANQLKPELVYRILIAVLPKSKIFLQYIKNRNEVKYSKELIDTVQEYYIISKKEAEEYVHMLFTLGKKDELAHLLERYGFNEKEIKKAMKT